MKKRAQSPHEHVEHVSSEEALSLLGVKRASFYTYVSRGLIRAVSTPGRKRNVYLRSDVEKLKARSAARLDTAPRAGQALRFGDPVIQTSICEVTPQGPRYRNRLALDLAAARRSFESVTELLWLGIWPNQDTPWTCEPPPKSLLNHAASLGRLAPLDYFALLAIHLGIIERERSELLQGTTVPAAKRLLQVFAGIGGLIGSRARFEPMREGELIAECFARGLVGTPSEEMVEAINCALVISAEHELAAPTFAARVAASTGAELQACIAAAILAQSGSLQGGGSDGVEDFLLEIGRREDLGKRWVPAGKSKVELPGFNHPLYLREDPRATFLINLAKSLKNQHPLSEALYALTERAAREFQYFPNIRAGLVVLAMALGLPPRSAGALWCLARSAGWVAHVMEQRLAAFMLRPRAKYVGA
jgi:citrate synthase